MHLLSCIRPRSIRHVFYCQLFLCLPVAMGSQTVFGQRGSRTLPNDTYFTTFEPFFAGEYKAALRGFRQSARGGIKSVDGRWIDGICYHTMMGECHFHMGNLADALQHHESALRLFVLQRNWMQQIQFPPRLVVSSVQRRTSINWGASTRRTQVGQFPRSMLSYQGRLNNDSVIQSGGVVRPPELVPVIPQEIARCTALSIRRRNQILGPVIPYTPLTGEVIAALEQRLTHANHWSQTWIDLQLGMAYAGVGETTKAISLLRGSLQIDGQFDHPLTAIGLLELGHIALRQEKYAEAFTYLLEATFAAVPDGQADVMEEAFRLGLTAHLVSGQQGLYSPLAPAAAWARQADCDRLHVSLLLGMSENAAWSNQLKESKAILDQAASVLRRRDMSAGRMGTRFDFQSAVLAFCADNSTVGMRSLAKSMKAQERGSLWQFHIAMADQLFSSKAISARRASQLYSKVLREPSSSDWLLDPMETIAYIVLPHLVPLENWFNLTVQRKEHEQAVYIGDKIRRHRFYGSLPFGGRMLSLRWLADGPQEVLDKKAKHQRDNLRMRHPELAQLSHEIAQKQVALNQLPWFPQDQGSVSRQKLLLRDLALAGQKQEKQLRRLVLQRVDGQFVFPPLLTTKKIQSQLEPGQAVLSFLQTRRVFHAALLTRENYAFWQLNVGRKLKSSLATLLRDMGNHDKNRLLSGVELADVAWQETASRIAQTLFGKVRAEVWNDIEELIIVPDKLLWYVPFEVLPVATRKGTSESLLSQRRIRYVPTTGLVVPDQRPHKSKGKTAVAVGRLFVGDEDEVAQAAFAELKTSLPDVQQLKSPLAGPTSLLVRQWHRLIVLDDLDDAGELPYDWTPVIAGRGTTGSRVAEWMVMPWGGAGPNHSSGISHGGGKWPKGIRNGR